MATAMDEMHSQHPDLPQHVTECTGGYPDGVCDITKGTTSRTLLVVHFVLLSAAQIITAVPSLVKVRVNTLPHSLFPFFYRLWFVPNIFTLSPGMEGFGWNHEWDMSNILLGAAAHWSSSGVKWILALDEHCGPTLPKVTFTNGRPLVAIPSWANSEQDVQYNQDYYSIKHMSKFLLSQGASHAANTTTTAAAAAAAVDGSSSAYGSTVRVATAVKSSDGTNTNNLILESFLNEKTHLVIVIAMNKDHSNALDIHLTQGEEVSFADSLPPFSTKVYQWVKK